jgi:hypothetical protein
MDTLNTALTTVIVLLAAITVFLAWKTLTVGKQAAADSKDAAQAARETVAALKTLLQISQETAAALGSSVDAARQTAEIARAARDADERYRQLDQLREIGRAVQRILLSALKAKDSDLSISTGSTSAHLADARWRSAEQNALKVLLVGAEPQLPKCSHLTGVSGVDTVIGAAQNADIELSQIFNDLGKRY